MSGRRSRRPRKSIDYSKLSSDKEVIDKDDDDFIKATPSKKRKEHQKSEVNALDKEKIPPTERRARNRLSEEEKYNKQLEEALKLSVIDASKSEDGKKCSNKDGSIPLHDMCVPLTVHVEVMDSPMSKQKRNVEATERNKNGNLSNCVKNGAILPGNDEITPAPAEDMVKSVKSRCCKTINTKRHDDDYQLSEESESDEEDDDEAFEDFQDKVPAKSKKRTETVKSSATKENKTTANTTVGTKNALKSRMSTTRPSSEKLSSSTKIVCHRKAASPMTPKSSNILSAKSPSLLQRKFSQPGWTPPGPAGTKVNSLKSSPSPSCIRVGLSRNARISPLHPRTIIG